MTPGACPHALAAEVYARTMRKVRRKFGHNPIHRQCVHDAVGEAFVRWYASASDKTEHAAGEHARWLTGTAGTHIRDTNPCKRRTARAVRSLASFGHDISDDEDHDDKRSAVRREAILRQARGAPEFAYAEDNVNEAIDAIHPPRLPPGASMAAFAAAMDSLKSSGWTDLAIATRIGVARAAVSSWRNGSKAAPKHHRASVVALASVGQKAPDRARSQSSKEKRR